MQDKSMKRIKYPNNLRFKLNLMEKNKPKKKSIADASKSMKENFNMQSPPQTTFSKKIIK